jgi:hypothetical protein
MRSVRCGQDLKNDSLLDIASLLDTPLLQNALKFLCIRAFLTSERQLFSSDWPDFAKVWKDFDLALVSFVTLQQVLVRFELYPAFFRAPRVPE